MRGECGVGLEPARELGRLAQRLLQRAEVDAGELRLAGELPLRSPVELRGAEEPAAVELALDLRQLELLALERALRREPVEDERRARGKRPVPRPERHRHGPGAARLHQKLESAVAGLEACFAHAQALAEPHVHVEEGQVELGVVELHRGEHKPPHQDRLARATLRHAARDLERPLVDGHAAGADEAYLAPPGQERYKVRLELELADHQLAFAAHRDPVPDDPRRRQEMEPEVLHGDRLPELFRSDVGQLRDERGDRNQERHGDGERRRHRDTPQSPAQCSPHRCWDLSGKTRLSIR